MNWKPISQAIKHTTRQILVVQWHKGESIYEYIADDYDDLQIYLAVNKGRKFTHWTYITPPKN